MLIYNILVFILGLAFGSFANTCSRTWLAEESIMKDKWSRCPCCGREIKFSEKIPVLGYILHKGKCSQCNWTIPIEYPCMELWMGFAFLTIFQLYGMTFMTLRLLVLLWAISVAFISDVKEMIIPDETHIVCIAFGIISVFFGEVSLLATLLGAFFPSIPLLLAIVFMERFVKSENGLMGGGDIKALFAYGAVGGISFSLYMLFASAVFETLTFGAYFFQDKAKGTQTEVPMMVGFMFAFIFMVLTNLPHVILMK